MRSFAPIGIMFATVPSAVEGHGIIAYASTPVTPPLGRLWAPVAFVPATALWDWTILNGIGLCSTGRLSGHCANTEGGCCSSKPFQTGERE
jgi:hypothetical protein